MKLNVCFVFSFVCSFCWFWLFCFFKEEIPKETSFPFKVVLSTCAEFNLLYVHCDNRANALKFTYLKSIIGLHCLFSLLFVCVFVCVFGFF